MFKKNKLSNAIVGILATSAVAVPVMAQEDGIEEVFVTGMRASLEASMDVKRNSTGVVDAISAEDIGKFPDSNLAESLQRITGVSVSRRNGEGADVTVRGFGAEYNMITLNGRMMPAARAYSNTQGTTRAFDFANLASESVSALEVYKTSKANIATGGMGATINIATSRPLDNPGFKASVGAKAVADSTNRTGSDITPELSGIVSWTDESEVFGVSLTGSYQERDSGSASASVNDWRVQEWVAQGEAGAMNIGIPPELAADMTPEEQLVYKNSRIVNAPQEGQLYGLPNDVRYHFSDNHRERTNAQLTLQFRPMENLTGTLDYTYAENVLEERRGDKTAWFTRTHDYVEFDFDQAVATPMIIAEDTSGRVTDDDGNVSVVGTKDFGFEQQYRNQTGELNSLGLNLEWAVNDSLSFTLDAHDSSMSSMPSGPAGAGDIQTSVATPIGLYQAYDFSGDLPTFAFLTDDTQKGNGDGIHNKEDIGSQMLRLYYSDQETDITQVKLDGAFDFENGRIDFGVETRAMEMRQKYSDTYQPLGDWGVTAPMDVPEGLMSDFCLSCEFDDYSSGPSDTDQVGFKGNAEEIGMWGAEEYGHDFAVNRNYSENHLVQEDTTAVYFQVSMQSDIGGMPTNMMAGLRYEGTDIESTTFQLIPEALRWDDNNDYYLVQSSEETPFSQKAKYDHLLPSFDFDIEVIENLKSRFSFSQTIARPSYGDMRAGITIDNPLGPTLTDIEATAASANPGLLPLESTNADISVEWYYDDSSYVSLGFYEKRVNNFIGRQNVVEEHFELRDSTNGPLAMAAQDAVAARDDHDGVVDETELFVMSAILDNPADFPGGADDYESGITFAEQIAGDYNIMPNDGSDAARPYGIDPYYQFLTDKPVNTEAAQISGFEFAVQHFFGDTGFGLQANYTTVGGDVSYDNSASPGDSQFALLGLSDSANLVAMYENYGVQARLAYNWRDEYLAETNRGGSNNPRYVEAYSQIDLNVAYDINDNINVFFEGLNITGENTRSHGRSTHQMWDLYDLGPRYQLGARYTF